MNDMTVSDNATLVVGEGTRVTLHFAVKLDDGSVVDSTFEREPATFEVGDGNLLEGFERALLGLAAGHRETFVITPENGFGQSNPNNVQKIPRTEFGDDVALEEGLMLSFADAQKAELPGVVTDFDDVEVTVDFNHPLAGRDLQFEVEILVVEPVQVH